MSDSSVLLSILGFLVAGFVSGNWVMRIANDRMDEILSGVVKGVAVPEQQRWLMLTNNWFPYAAFLIVFLAIMGLGFYRLAGWAQDTMVQRVGYFSAMMCATASVFWLALGVIWVLHLRSVLRQSRSD